MEFVTCVVAADEDELAEVAQSAAPLDGWSGIETPGLDTVKLATLHALLTGDPLQVALDLYEPALVAGGDEETLVLRVAGEMLEELALLDEESLETVAGELAATEIYEEEDADPDELLSLLTPLAELAQLAESQGQVLFVRIELIQD
ncbi:hypothetical protein [Propionivibrio sp.]|uniref:hypothetical protein n=1 Tax=Propionivibrio sp. TaxID=2212460 RepID=UPI0039E25B4B